VHWYLPLVYFPFERVSLNTQIFLFPLYKLMYKQVVAVLALLTIGLCVCPANYDIGGLAAGSIVSI